jgi:hypothetical protein
LPKFEYDKANNDVFLLELSFGVAWPDKFGITSEETHDATEPASASGTLNPLLRVLYTVRSLYLCNIGLMLNILDFEGYTSRFKLHSQTILHLDYRQIVLDVAKNGVA